MQAASAVRLHDAARYKVSTYVIAENSPDGRHIDARAWNVTREASRGALQDLSGLSDPEAVARLRAAALHIAVDHGGYCRYARPGVLSLLTAPIQINYPCFLATLGASRRPHL